MILIFNAVKTVSPSETLRERVAAGEPRRTIPLSPKGTEFLAYREVL